MIRLRQVTKSYPTRTGSFEVLRGIDIEVNPGQRLGILGRNGAGKSTLIRLLSGAERPTSGDVVRGMSVSWPLAFGGGFQSALSGLDNFRFICRVYGVQPADRQPFVEEFSELGGFLREPVRTYSAGMRARLAFAISMSIEFDCYLIDEIIAVGDERFRERCAHELFERRADRALIMVSHMPDVLRVYCHHFGVLQHGKMHRFDDIDEALNFHGSSR